MDSPEATRQLPDVTIHVEETRPGFFEVSFRPTAPESHLARSGFAVDTAAGVRGRNHADVLEWAEKHWRQNYPLEPDEPKNRE